jgi:hypothetical protein
MSVYCLEERYRNNSWTETFLSFDLFGATIPVYNFEGRNKIGTPIGLVSTGMFVTLLGAFAGFKGLRFANGANPLISESEEIDFYDEDNRIKVDEIRMMSAF